MRNYLTQGVFKLFLLLTPLAYAGDDSSLRMTDPGCPFPQVIAQLLVQDVQRRAPGVEIAQPPRRELAPNSVRARTRSAIYSGALEATHEGSTVGYFRVTVWSADGDPRPQTLEFRGTTVADEWQGRGIAQGLWAGVVARYPEAENIVVTLAGDNYARVRRTLREEPATSWEDAVFSSPTGRTARRLGFTEIVISPTDRAALEAYQRLGGRSPLPDMLDVTFRRPSRSDL